VVFGCLVAVLTNLATAGGTGPSTLGGLVAGILVWAGWEAWRAIRGAGDRGGASGRG
jgi:hypothetical protein